MKVSETSPNRLAVWGDSTVNKLPAISRKRRKREASKKRRVLLRKDLNRRCLVAPKHLPALLFVMLFVSCSNEAGPDKSHSEAGSAYTPQLGDVVFHSSQHTPLIDMIEGSTDSPYSHCGIVDQVDGQWVVYEAAARVRATPLEDFLGRGRGQAFTVYRLKDEHQPAVPETLAKAKAYLGLPYDFRYRMDDEHIYCSELVYKAFRDATGGELGELVTLDELSWQAFEPLIVELEGGPVPLDRQIITPRDLALAEQLELVYADGMEPARR